MREVILSDEQDDDEKNRKTYKVTIHQHVIYDAFIRAVSEDEAQEIAEEQIIEQNTVKWREDYNAGWTEVGDIHDVDEEDEVD